MRQGSARPGRCSRRATGSRRTASTWSSAFVETHGRADTAKLDRGAGGRPPAEPALPGHRPGGNGRGCRPAPQSPGRPRGRTGPYQCPGKPERQAVRGRPGPAGGRNPCHHDDERPASGEPLRHRGAGRRGEGAGAPARQRPGRGGSDRQRGSHAGGSAGTPAGGQGLSGREDRDRAFELLPGLRIWRISGS